MIFGAGCVMIADIKDRSLVSIDSNRYKNVLFFISHKKYRIHWSAPKTGYQMILKNYFCSSACANASAMEGVEPHQLA
jgi:hypothetical protein